MGTTELTRNQRLLESIDLHGHGLEIGPLCWPVLQKSDANIQYVDHTDTATLRKLYKNDSSVPSKQIVEIDYPLNGRSLLQAVGHKRFDYIIASHVIEHVPDLIRWVDDMASVLNPGGVLSLAIPDKRFTFDIDRNVSRPADVIGAHLDQLKKPSSVTVFDYLSNYRSKVDPQQAWDGQLYMSEEACPHRYSLKDAQKCSLINRDTDTYVDTHCFVFTPASFVEVVRALIGLKLLPYQVASFHETSEGHYEFFVSLRKAEPAQQTALLASLPQLPPDQNPRELTRTITDLSEALEQSQQAVESAHDELHGIRHSISWRLTQPLRSVAKLIRRGN